MSVERRDLPARAVLLFAGGVAVSVALVLAATRATLDVLAARRPAPPPAVAPRPEAALEDVRREEAERLGGYGWTDRARGLARIPIERAMELLLERGAR